MDTGAFRLRVQEATVTSMLDAAVEKGLERVSVSQIIWVSGLSVTLHFPANAFQFDLDEIWTAYRPKEQYKGKSTAGIEVGDWAFSRNILEKKPISPTDRSISL